MRRSSAMCRQSNAICVWTTGGNCAGGRCGIAREGHGWSVRSANARGAGARRVDGLGRDGAVVARRPLRQAEINGLADWVQFGPPSCSDVEGFAAATAALLVGVAEHEPRLQLVLDV